MHAPWRIELLGGIRATRGNQIIERFADQRAAALLACLALSPDRVFPREELIELLWPESNPQPLRVRLNHYLWTIRQQLEPSGVSGNAVLATDRHSVRLVGSSVVTDVAELEERVETARQTPEPHERKSILADAVKLYRGELLPGVHYHWALLAREHSSDLLRDALERLGRTCEELGDAPGAVAAYRKLVRDDNLNEGAHCALIRSLLRAGRASQAVAQYEELASVLAEEIGDEPSAEARRLLEHAQRAQREGIREPLVAPASKPVGAETDVPSRLESQQDLLSGPVVASVPLQITPFFGREEELHQIEQALTQRNQRVITLTGPGGSGKTRLAIQAALHSRERWNQVMWIPLADLTGGRFVTDSVLSACGLTRMTGMEPIQQIASILRVASQTLPALLVIDNAEHLVDQTVEFLLRLLSEVDGVRVIVTSRQRLGLVGEYEMPVVPLPTPDVRQSTEKRSVEEALSYPSVQLFLDRAQASRPYFQITPRNAAPIMLLCQRLEGIPLALEIAASWAHVLGPVQILEQLNNRFDLLVARSKGLPPRHRSLRAVLEGSYESLPLGLQEVFRKLCVFQNGFTVESVLGVITADSVKSAKTLVEQRIRTNDALAELRERSLIVPAPMNTLGQDVAVRFGMLETLREFGAELLSEDEMNVLRDRHLQYFLSFGEKIEALYFEARDSDWRSQADLEVDNILAALDWSVTSGQPSLGLTLLVSLRYYWLDRTHWTELRGVLQRLLALCSESDDALDRERVAWAHEILAVAHTNLNERTDAERNFLQAIRFFEEAQSPSGLSSVFRAYGIFVFFEDHERSRSLFEKAVAYAEQTGNREAQMKALISLGGVYFRGGELDQCEEILIECFNYASAIGDRVYQSNALHNLAAISLAKNRWQEAERLLKDVVQVSVELGKTEQILMAMLNLAQARFCAGNRESASSTLGEAIAYSRRVKCHLEFSMWLSAFVKQLAINGHFELAATLGGASNNLNGFLGVAKRPEVQEALSKSKEALGEARLADLLSLSKGRGVDDLMDFVQEQLADWSMAA